MEEPGGLAKDGLMLEIYLLNLSLGRKRRWGGEGQSKVQDDFQAESEPRETRPEMPGVKERSWRRCPLGRNEMCQRLEEEAQPGSKGNHCTEEGIGERRWMKQSVGAARGASRVARVWG